MASADDYAKWIVANPQKRGTPEFETVVSAYRDAQKSEAVSADASEKPGVISSAAAGAGAEFGNVVLSGQKLLGQGFKKLDEMVNGRNVSSLVTGKSNTPLGRAGDWLEQDALQGKAKLQNENAPYKEAHPVANGTGRFVSDVVATAPVGGLIVKGAKAVLPGVAATQTGANVLSAIESSGMTGGGLVTRSFGGAVTGGASAAVVDPESAGLGAFVGGMAPGFFKLAGMGGDAFASLIRPFFASGQQDIVAKVLKQYSNDPRAAVDALKKAREIVPGSKPTTAAASGDAGLSGLTRTLQSSSPDFAAEMANRSSAQNAARTNVLEGVAGNQGKIAVAKETRNASTAGLRENALAQAGVVDTKGIIGQIDNLLANPSNAGQTAQNALQRVRDQISKAGPSGQIDARALYEIRKDAGLAMNGKLGGEASNLRYAKGQLNQVQDLIDDVIERAGSQPTNALAQMGPNANGANGTGWRNYLTKYAEASTPINQMEKLQEVLKRVQTGSVDGQGNLILSASKLNAILKNEGDDLAKALTPKQLQTLRNIAADLNATQLGMNSGRAVGSNTVQNLAGDQLLSNTLGAFGASTPVRTTVGNVLRIPYGRANQEIQNKLGNALLNPEEAVSLMERNVAPNALSLPRKKLTSLVYRSQPLLTTNDR